MAIDDSLFPDTPVELQAAYEHGRQQGILQGRHEAAEALIALSNTPCRYVKADWVATADESRRDVMDIWLSAVQAVTVARGDL